METIVLAYICAAIAWAFAFYISYLYIYKKLEFKKFILLIALWGAYTHSPLLTAIDVSGLSEIKIYAVIIFYLLTIITVVVGYAVACFFWMALHNSARSIQKMQPPPLVPPSSGVGPLDAFNALLAGAGQRRYDDGLRGLQHIKLIFVMVSGEYLRGVVLSILFLGENSKINVSDATFSIANALALTPLSRLSYFGHIYYLTFILFLIIVVVFETHSRYKKYLSKNEASFLKDKMSLFNKVLWPLTLLFIFISLQLLYIKYVYYQYHERQSILHRDNINTINKNNIWPEANILLIPSDIPMHYDMKNIIASTTFNKINNDYQNKLDKIIRNINSTNTLYDMVILPENVAYATSLKAVSLKSGKDLYKGIPILSGLLSEKEEGAPVSNTSIYTDSKNGITYRNKAYLFPFYEYKPYIANLIPNYIYKKDIEVMAGEGVVDFYLDKGKSIYKWTTIICSEFYSYNYLKALKVRDYDFIISQSSLGIFNHSHWMHANILLSQIINSNYLAVPIINVSNSAPSYLIIDNEIKYYHDDTMPFSINMSYPHP